MTKEERVFMIDNGLKELSFYCGDDACFEAKFVTKKGIKSLFLLSREKTLDYLRLKYPDVDIKECEKDKEKLAHHFAIAAMDWYRNNFGKSTIFKAKDGKVFNDQKECERHNNIIRRCKSVFADLRPRTLVKDGIAVQQDLLDVEIAYKCFLGFCAADVLPQHKDDLLDVAMGKRNMEIASAILSDYYEEYPMLYATWLRFNYINMTSGVEYDRIYYAMHEDEFKGKVI